jgi:hypothetical protein
MKRDQLSQETIVNTTFAIRNLALMVFFAGIGFGFFTENVRAVQMLGLFVTGIGFGAALTTLVSALRSRRKDG